MSHFRKEEPYTSRLNHVKGVTPPLGAPHKNMKGDAKHKALKAKTGKIVSHDNNTESGRIANLEILRSKMHKAWGTKNKDKVDMHFTHLKKD